jgi:uncharacterized protein YciI
MKFVNYAMYIQDQAKVAELRPAHRQYMARLLLEGKLAAAGPFADGSGGLFIYEAQTPEEAEILVAGDPYVQGGAFASREIKAWNVVNANADLFRSAN